MIRARSSHKTAKCGFNRKVDEWSVEEILSLYNGEVIDNELKLLDEDTKDFVWILNSYEPFNAGQVEVCFV